jgi:hypothetical protein
MRLTPMKRRDYEKWIRKHGWTLEKSGIDWTLVDSANTRICTSLQKKSHSANLLCQNKPFFRYVVGLHASKAVCFSLNLHPT